MPGFPNIVLIICHDLGRHLPCYGVSSVQSPNLDRLAAESVVFENAFCTAPQCSPSRASLFTGRYPHSNGVMGLTHFGWDLHPGERHLAGILRNVGYDCALAGMQHETRRPAEMGYDLLPVAHTDVAPYEWRVKADDVADAACAWLDAEGRQHAPFYLQVGIEEPHRLPGHPDGEFGFKADPEAHAMVPPYLRDTPEARLDFAEFQAAIEQLDMAVGRILKQIETNELADTTLVLFTTDHGIPFPRAKCTLMDPGLEVALMMRGPRLPPRRTDALISHVDLLPTLLEYLGVPVPEAVQGQSFHSVLAGHTDRHREALFGEMTYHDYCDPRRCIRTRTHKLIANFTIAPFLMDPSQSWNRRTTPVTPAAPPLAYHPPFELYDLTVDPGEIRNLHEEPGYGDTAEMLAAELHRWILETGDPLIEGIPTPPRHRQVIAAMRDYAAIVTGVVHPPYDLCASDIQH